MCYNCGCQMPDNDMGKPTNITNKTFAAAAKGEGQKPEEARRNAYELLKKEFGAGSAAGTAAGASAADKPRDR